MKQLKCEMCGGTDIIKQDGLYVCQSCGVKYSVEEARKMMIEGVVDVRILHDDENRILKKQADEAFEEGRFADATRLYADLLNKQDCDYETVFRRWFAQANCQGSIFNKLPYQLYSLETLVKKLDSYFDNILQDSKILDDKKTEKIISIIEKVVHLLWVYMDNERLHFNESYNRHLRECAKVYDSFYVAIISITKKHPPLLRYVKSKIEDRKKYSCLCRNLISNGFRLEEHYQEIVSFEKEIVEREKESRKKAYWEKNIEIRKSFEKEKAELLIKEKEILVKVKELKVSIEKVASSSFLSKKEDEIERLKKQKKSCGIFEFKEKKNIIEKIDKVSIERENILKQIEKEQKPLRNTLIFLEAEMEKIRIKICQIDAEFTKDR